MANQMLEVLERIDTARWGRQTALISLLALEELPRSLRKHELQEELGRSSGGVKYDLRVLERLRSDRVVICWPGIGRRPHLWAVNHRVEQWRHVPWLGRAARRQALLIASQVWEPFVQQRVVFPGQSVDVWEPHPPKWRGRKPLTRRDEVPTTARVVPTTAQITGSDLHVFGGQVPTTAQSEAAPVLSLPIGRDISLPREGTSDDDSSEDREPDRLRRAINAHGHRIIRDSQPARRLRVLEMKYPDRVDELEALAHELAPRLRSFMAVIEALEEAAHRPPVARPPEFYRAFTAETVAPEELEAGRAAAAEALRAAQEALGRPAPQIP